MSNLIRRFYNNAGLIDLIPYHKKDYFKQDIDDIEYSNQYVNLIENLELFNKLKDKTNNENFKIFEFEFKDFESIKSFRKYRKIFFTGIITVISNFFKVIGKLIGLNGNSHIESVK
jgi:hypothetical protein